MNHCNIMAILISRINGVKIINPHWWTEMMHICQHDFDIKDTLHHSLLPYLLSIPCYYRYRFTVCDTACFAPYTKSIVCHFIVKTFRTIKQLGLYLQYIQTEAKVAAAETNLSIICDSICEETNCKTVKPPRFNSLYQPSWGRLPRSTQTTLHS